MTENVFTKIANVFAGQWLWLILTTGTLSALVYYEVTEHRVFMGTNTEHFKPTQSNINGNSHVHHK